MSGTTAGGPVALDEETELAVLAEVEREIFSGMDVLEDAFQALHLKAEAVRTALQHRQAGLAMQARLRAYEADLSARTETPGGVGDARVADGRPWSAASGFGLGEMDDDGMSGIVSLAPDDSASNIGWKRREESKLRERERRPQVRDGGVLGGGKARRWFGLGLGGVSGKGRVDVVREED